MARFLCPDEWQSAIGTLRELHSVATTTPRFFAKQLLFFGLFWSGGASVGWFVYPFLEAAVTAGNGAAVESFYRGVMSALGILMGFMVALMVFTGKTEAWKSLSFEQAQLFVEKSSYLLFSQFLTIVNHATVVGLCILWSIAFAAENVSGRHAITVCTFGFLFVSGIRTILVPLQIAELHQFALHALLNEKERELMDAARSK